MIRKTCLSIAALLLASNITVGGLFALSAVTVPVVDVSVGSVVLSGGALAVLMAEVACSKSQLVAAGEDVLSAVTDQALINALRAISSDALAKLEALVPDAQKLVAALKNGDTSSALALVNTIFPVIEDIVASVSNDPKIAGFLALGNLALHFILNHTKSTAAAVAARKAGVSAVQVADDNGAQPVWGCQYAAKDRRAQYQKLCG